MCFPLTSDSPTYPNVATGTADIALIRKGDGNKSFSNMDSICIHFSFLCNFEEGGRACFKQSNALVCYAVEEEPNTLARTLWH